MELLSVVGLADRAKAYPSQLSGGQKQRVAIARALATKPRYLLCDEATSALDPTTTQSILSLLKEINRSMGVTVIVITHQMSVVEQICQKVAILDNGEVAEQGDVHTIFSTPQSKAAKALVYPDGCAETASAWKGNIIRVVFNGAQATSTPLIAQMAMEKNIAASILGASTRAIGEKVFGNMLLGIPGDRAQLNAALSYLGAVPDIYVEEVKSDVC